MEFSMFQSTTSFPFPWLAASQQILPLWHRVQLLFIYLLIIIIIFFFTILQYDESSQVWRRSH